MTDRQKAKVALALLATTSAPEFYDPYVAVKNALGLRVGAGASDVGVRSVKVTFTPRPHTEEVQFD